MRTIKDPKEMQAYSLKMKGQGKTIGFVPTMGYLHEGHLSLVAAAKTKADIVVVSIFVNPTQFGPEEDFRSYPRDLKHDKKLLNDFAVDILFFPSAARMYPKGSQSFVDPGGLAEKMCGLSRPNHFRGVDTIVAKLFNIVQPNLAFFGEKDYQQQLIIRKMTEELNFPTKVISLPTIREFDGLAMSSRNKYLLPEQRKQAAILYQVLRLAKKEIKGGEKNSRRLLSRLRRLMASAPSLKLDYLVIVDPETLEETKTIKGKTLIALAAYIGKTRLIDNLVVETK
ncbi:MAG: pantoate--beta-alanine ligase [Candidatus Margulisiibacteriota bacterium]